MTAIRCISEKCDSFYLYDEQSIIERTTRLQTAMPFACFLYSVKCNHNPRVLDTVFANGFGTDAASAGEVLSALEHGLLPENIEMPYLKPGDMVAVNNAGAYAAVLSPMQFSSQKRPEEYFLRIDGTTENCGFQVKCNDVF